MAIISLQCNNLSQLATIKCLLQAEDSMTGRAHMGEVLIQIWLIVELLSTFCALFDKSMKLGTYSLYIS